MLEQKLFEDWKERLGEMAKEYSISADNRTDDTSARRVAILVAEEFGRAFKGHDINSLVLALSALEARMYTLARDAKLVCDPLERETPPASWRGSQREWAQWHLKVHEPVLARDETVEKLAQTALKVITEERSEGDGTERCSHRRRSYGRVGAYQAASVRDAAKRAQVYAARAKKAVL